MGDRCYMEVRCHSADVHKMEKFHDWDEKRIEDSEVVLSDCEANYALNLPENWPTDFPYYGWHDDGGNYDGSEFACDGKELVVVDATSHLGPVVHVAEDGVNIEDIEHILKYYRVLKVAKEAIERP